MDEKVGEFHDRAALWLNAVVDAYCSAVVQFVLSGGDDRITDIYVVGLEQALAVALVQYVYDLRMRGFAGLFVICNHVNGVAERAVGDRGLWYDDAGHGLPQFQFDVPEQA